MTHTHSHRPRPVVARQDSIVSLPSPPSESKRRYLSTAEEELPTPVPLVLYSSDVEMEVQTEEEEEEEEEEESSPGKKNLGFLRGEGGEGSQEPNVSPTQHKSKGKMAEGDRDRQVTPPPIAGPSSRMGRGWQSPSNPFIEREEVEDRPVWQKGKAKMPEKMTYVL